MTWFCTSTEFEVVVDGLTGKRKRKNKGRKKEEKQMLLQFVWLLLQLVLAGVVFSMCANTDLCYKCRRNEDLIYCFSQVVA